MYSAHTLRDLKCVCIVVLFTLDQMTNTKWPIWCDVMQRKCLQSQSHEAVQLLTYDNKHSGKEWGTLYVWSTAHTGSVVVTVLCTSTVNQVNTKMVTVTICRCITLTSHPDQFSLASTSWAGTTITGNSHGHCSRKKSQFLHDSMLCYRDCWRTDLIS